MAEASMNLESERTMHETVEGRAGRGGRETTKKLAAANIRLIRDSEREREVRTYAAAAAAAAEEWPLVLCCRSQSVSLQ